ncbi:50S ribosomal protein L24e [Natronomonas gomsonensis]|jgi:large subunit ribosomal protein L24e|uniref:50S ribosomal protein L24e n=1 Tax=Natronomonas gomsonensis TaxID=1046043 RepID=UPI0020CA92A5|nr:50S ribosomal protein L24e [Natronomonas gomsonensis]MCY4728940.1 50S ribosomal protein L24e [Natronomonas gomsonensis]
MPQTRECDYCGADIEPGSGTMFVRVDGSVTHYCSGKCEKNADLGREPRDLEWTETARAEGQAAEAEPEAEPDAEPEEDTEATTPDLEAAESESAADEESAETDEADEAEDASSDEEADEEEAEA